MASLSFAIRSSLGFLPKTEKIESSRQKLEGDYNRLKEIESSDELKEYLELKGYIESDDFQSNKKKILALNFKNTDEFAKEAKFLKLKKNKQIVQYFKMLNSEQYKQFKITEDSSELEEFNALSEKINTDAHISEKNTFAKALATEKEKEKEFDKLKKNKKIKNYLRVIKLEAFKNYAELEGSEKLERFNELKEFALSNDLKNLKADLKAKAKSEDAVNYADTEEAAKEQEYNTLKNAPEIKSYFKFIKSKAFKIYNEVHNSADLQNYYELEQYVLSDDYKNALSSLNYELTDGFKDETRFNELSQLETIKNYNKLNKSKKYTEFTKTQDADILKEYFELEELTNSEKFTEYKAYMLDKNKFEKTDDFAKEARLKELQNNEDIKWYLATKDADKFKALFAWNLTFEDDFTSNKVDESKWMNSFFWGKMLLDERYVIAGEKHFYTDNKNTEITDSTLKIITRKEQAKGKVWHPLHGFSEQNFNYTSGMLSSASSFRQKYGKFEAKIKLDPSYPTYQAFWLKGEQIVPEIDVLKFNMDKKNKLQLANYGAINGDNNNTSSTLSKLNGAPFTKDFFIYTLEWTPEKISWLINGIEIYQTTENIPNEPLYILFSSGISKDPKDENINSSFEIDWVRCYEKAE